MTIFRYDAAERWRQQARWHLGDITDAEYAQYLEDDPEFDKDNPVIRPLLRRLRGLCPSCGGSGVRCCEFGADH